MTVQDLKAFFKNMASFRWFSGSQHFSLASFYEDFLELMASPCFSKEGLHEESFGPDDEEEDENSHKIGNSISRQRNEMDQAKKFAPELGIPFRPLAEEGDRGVMGMPATAFVLKLVEFLRKQPTFSKNEAFCLFLVDAASFVSAGLFCELGVYLLALKEHLIEKEKTEHKEQPESSEKERLELEKVAKEANDFICGGFLGFMNSWKPPLRFLETSGGITPLHVLIMKFFCNWLCQRKFCKLYLEISKDEV